MNRKNRFVFARAAAAVLLFCLLLSGCSREGGLFSADDYYLVNGSSVAEESESEAESAESEAVSGTDASSSEGEEPAAEEIVTEPEGESPGAAYKDVMQTVWVAYWDDHIAEALDMYGDVIQNICVFAASYDPDGQVFLPGELTAQVEMIREKSAGHSWNIYLSVTNDIVASGWSSAKDVDLLHHLLDSPEDAKKHAAELAALAQENGFDGLEIDFEALHGDMELWKSFLVFEEALIEESGKRSLPLRIVLEPATPKEGLTFPEGPEYVMMCYDLHGFGTEPGAKADRDFLIGLVEDFAFIPDLGFALANGGYDWNVETGYVTTLSEQNIQKLLAEHEFDKERGDTSGALHGIYEDEDEDKREVWYADAETLQLWYDYLSDAAGHPVRCSLWKL